MKNKNMLIRILLLSFLNIINVLSAQSEDSKFTKVKTLGGIEEYLYTPNGMKVLVLQDNTTPVVTVQIVYEVGSKHEVTGNTGSTHLLEHLMFKGTEKFNKNRGTSIPSKLNSIGARMNATTWKDRTNYYETIPSDKIEMALEIEADRMRNSLLLKEDKDSEMTVVRNEFERGENNPNRLLSKEIWAAAYVAHPYHHLTIGWRSDIEKMPIEVLRKFYNTYYWPDNATLTVIGDFQKDTLFKLVDTYFGKITKSPYPIPQPYTEEPEQLGPRKVVIKKPGQQGVVSIGYKIPGRLHKDLPALTVLGEIMGNGTSSIINKTFIDTGLALYGYSNPSKYREVGLFTVGLGFTQDKQHEDMNNRMLEMIEQIKDQGVLQEDIDRVVAKINAQSILSRDGSGNIAGQLNEAIAGGDWTDYILAAEKLSKVNAKDIKYVANTYFVEDQSTTGFFIPKEEGNNPPKREKNSNYINQNDEVFYFRNPEDQNQAQSPVQLNDDSEGAAIKNIVALENDNTPANIKDGFTRKEIANIDVVTVKTGVKGFLSVKASFPIGTYFNTGKNKMVPTLTTALLSKGTLKRDKFQFSQKLEKLGVSLDVNSSTHYVTISFKCLKKDLATVVDLLAEELRYPLFDEKELEILKKQLEGSINRGLSNPGIRGSIALSQAIYPDGHPNYSSNIEDKIEDLNKASIKELKVFHENFFGPAGMHLVAVGDVDTKDLHKALGRAFKNWKGGITANVKYTNTEKSKAISEVITIPQKPSAEMYIGQYTGIERNSEDYLPFYIGTSILGRGFSGRLMKTVRDEQGLTYSINARHSGHQNTGGYWYANASFNPKLFQKGLDATMIEITKWAKDGSTAEELAFMKDNLIGGFKVSLETTGGLANSILGFLERGLEPNYIDKFSEDIKNITLKEVNDAIKKYVDLDKLIIIKSGSLDENGNP